MPYTHYTHRLSAQLTLVKDHGGKLDVRRASNVSLNAMNRMLDDSDEDEDGDVMDMSAMLSMKPKTPQGNSVRAGKSFTQNGRGRRMSALNAGGPLRRGMNQQDNSRNTAFIATFLNDHLNKKAESDSKIQGMIETSKDTPPSGKPPMEQSVFEAESSVSQRYGLKVYFLLILNLLSRTDSFVKTS
jgi:hypothetical protein